jgi:glycine/D-amino acid oxidase-like deaminating enzyme
MRGIRCAWVFGHERLEMSKAEFQVAIVGAGIVGAACADEFARRGMRVVLVDRDGVGSGATAAAMGHIVVMDDSIWVAADDEEMMEVHRKHEYYGKRGVPTEVLDARALRVLEPNLRGGLAGGLLVPEDVVVYPQSAARFLTERARRHGAEIRLGCVARMGAGRIQLSDSADVSAEIIVNAAGIWASELTAGVEIKRRKGHLVLTGRHPGFMRHQLVELGYLKSAHAVSSDSVAFNVQPRRGGEILIGSSRQYGAEHKEVDEAMLERMLLRAREYMPGLGEMAAGRSWAGFRAATADKLPLIGPWPGDESVFLATGHEGLGITTSLGTARILVDQITGAKPEIPVEPYWPSRAAAQ